jgi:hypothetical protein
MNVSRVIGIDITERCSQTAFEMLGFGEMSRNPLITTYLKMRHCGRIKTISFQHNGPVIDLKL